MHKKFLSLQLNVNSLKTSSSFVDRHIDGDGSSYTITPDIATEKLMKRYGLRYRNLFGRFEIYFSGVFDNTGDNIEPLPTIEAGTLFTFIVNATGLSYTQKDTTGVDDPDTDPPTYHVIDMPLLRTKGYITLFTYNYTSWTVVPTSSTTATRQYNYQPLVKATDLIPVLKPVNSIIVAPSSGTFAATETVDLLDSDNNVVQTGKFNTNSVSGDVNFGKLNVSVDAGLLSSGIYHLLVSSAATTQQPIAVYIDAKNELTQACAIIQVRKDSHLAYPTVSAEHWFNALYYPLDT